MQSLKSYSSQRKHSDKQQLRMEEKSQLAMLVLIQTGLWSLAIMVLIWQTLRINTLAGDRPSFVQMQNGEAVYVAQRDRYFRTPQSIQKVVLDWATLTYNWDGKLPGSDQRDEGLAAPNNAGKVPTSTWFASTLLSKGFAEKSLGQIAPLAKDALTKNLESVLIPTYVSEPKQIAEGKWKVDMTATRKVIDRSTGERTTFEVNHTFTVQAVEPPQSPLGDKASFIEQRIYQLRAAGLEISEIADFTPQNR
jgi:hypothetical protein